ncbi:MAG: hypothetical protein NTU94_11575 [Planctomycetota bacterium]|nr:hypothetical protein [Planctomycetota bacterium]
MDEFLLLPADADVTAEAHRLLRIRVDRLAVDPDLEAVPVVHRHRDLAGPLAVEIGKCIGDLVGLVLQRFGQVDPVELRGAPSLVVRLLREVEPLPGEVADTIALGGPEVGLSGRLLLLEVLQRVGHREGADDQPFADEALVEGSPALGRSVGGPGGLAGRAGHDALGDPRPPDGRVGVGEEARPVAAPADGRRRTFGEAGRDRNQANDQEGGR